ncbi:MAG: rhombosortase [Gammaproteobacteria bacterium]|nr:rhombosortase [Gammaproteobacteria bacterium]
MWQRIRNSPDWHFFGYQFLIVVTLQVIGVRYFRYDHDWLENGQIWRIVSAHWVHVGWVHMFLNMVGLMICISLSNPRWSVRRWFLQSLCIAIGISVLFTLQNSDLHWYVGFSGVLFGLYFLAAHDLYARDRLIASLMGGAIVIKVILEQYTNYDIDSSDLIGAPVIVDAHLYGLMMAIAIALVWATYTMNHGPNRQSN